MAGYDGFSMSNNARDAYASGKVPISRVTRARLDALGIDLTVAEAKRQLREIGPCEWHHTSKEYNQTDFYDLTALLTGVGRRCEACDENVSTRELVHSIIPDQTLYPDAEPFESRELLCDDCESYLE